MSEPTFFARVWFDVPITEYAVESYRDNMDIYPGAHSKMSDKELVTYCMQYDASQLMVEEIIGDAIGKVECYENATTN